MSNIKPTDAEIIKALEDYIAKVIRLQDGFLLDGKDSTKLELLLKNALDLINRQTTRLRKVEHQLDEALKMYHTQSRSIQGICK